MANSNNQVDHFFRRADTELEPDFSAYQANWSAMEMMLLNKPAVIVPRRWNPGMLNGVIGITVAVAIAFGLIKIKINNTPASNKQLTTETSKPGTETSQPGMENNNPGTKYNNPGSKNDTAVTEYKTAATGGIKSDTDNNSHAIYNRNLFNESKALLIKQAPARDTTPVARNSMHSSDSLKSATGQIPAKLPSQISNASKVSKQSLPATAVRTSIKQTHADTTIKSTPAGRVTKPAPVHQATKPAVIRRATKSTPARAAAQVNEVERAKLSGLPDTAVSAGNTVIIGTSNTKPRATPQPQEQSKLILSEVLKPAAFDFDTIIHVIKTNSVSVSKPVLKKDSSVLNEQKSDRRNKKPQKHAADSSLRL